MKKDKNTQKIYKPINLISYAKEWFNLYKMGLSLPFGDRLNVLYSSHCSLLFSLEFLLKSLITFLDKEYEKEEKLIELGHNFSLMIKKIEEKATNNNEIKEILNEIKDSLNYLIEIDPIELRYPPLYSLNIYQTELNPNFENILKKVNKLITNKNE